MKDLAGKTAVITGGGGGIGRGMALAFAESGMRVVLADVEEQALDQAAADLRAAGAEVLPVVTDVTSRESLGSLAEAAYTAFGGVHLLCNNAGVTTIGTIATLTERDWEWVLSVNLQGVVNGLQTFLPRMLEEEGECHIVNTSSTTALQGMPAFGPYVASKFAVAGLSEALHQEVAGQGVGVSILCPGSVTTGIVGSARNRPDELGGPSTEVNPFVQKEIEAGLDPEFVGQLVRDAVVAGDLYIFTHPVHSRQAIDARDAWLREGLANCEARTR